MNQNLKKTILYDWHVAHKGRMVPFAGYAMPVQYEGVIEEHLAVRNQVGIFDVSHMGEFRVTGPQAETFLQEITCNDLSKIGTGKAQYSMLLYDNGGVVDDIIIYKIAVEEFLVVVNASNIEKDFAWMCEQQKKFPQIILKNESEDWSLFAVQGPLAADLLAKLDVNLAAMQSFTHQVVKISGIECRVARTGYTGEPGWELFVKNADALKIWEKLFAISEGKLKPIGLGARDTLRLEMAYPLYGHELSDVISPLAAGLDWVVKLNKENFMGKSALLLEKQQGLKRKLMGFELVEPGVVREGFSILNLQNQKLGEVTSGTFSPSLKKSIFLALCSELALGVGEEIYVDIRGKMKKAKQVSLPFYHKGATH